MVWRHGSGRKSLLTTYSAKCVVGMDRAESDALLKRLLARAERPGYAYRHDWQVGDLLVWDNTGTMHRVAPFALDSGRELHRVTLPGEDEDSRARTRCRPIARAPLTGGCFAVSSPHP